MDCYKTFTLSISQTRTFSTLGTNVKTWGLANYWEVYLNSVNTTKNITGFKNINIYKIRMVGDVGSSLGINSAIVEDFGFAVSCGGQIPQIGGTISPNGYAATDSNSAFFLTRYTNEVYFPDGIQSVQTVAIGDFFASGIGAETINNIQLSLAMDFIFYYKFEGE